MAFKHTLSIPAKIVSTIYINDYLLSPHMGMTLVNGLVHATIPIPEYDDAEEEIIMKILKPVFEWARDNLSAIPTMGGAYSTFVEDVNGEPDVSNHKVDLFFANLDDQVFFKLRFSNFLN